MWLSLLIGRASQKSRHISSLPRRAYSQSRWVRPHSAVMSEARWDIEAARRKVAALTAPRNVVIVGASDRPASWAQRVWQNLGRHGFAGPIYPVNPNRSAVWGQRCFPDLGALPEPPDHLVVLVPAPGVEAQLRAGAAAGARSATVFSAGFGEAGDEAGL